MLTWRVEQRDDANQAVVWRVDSDMPARMLWLTTPLFEAMTFASIEQKELLMEWVFAILIAFGIVGSVEARVRALMRIHEIKLDRICDQLERCESKLDKLLGDE